MKLRVIAAVLLIGTAAAQDEAKATQGLGAPTAGYDAGSSSAPPAAAAATAVPSAPAATTATTAPRDEASSRRWYALYDGPNFGLQIDAGVPAGAAAAFVFRPWYLVRLNAGVAYDALAVGVKGGITLVPFHWGVVPTLGLEGGHFWQGDATKFGTASDPVVNTILKSVGYDYLSADIGIEFGSQNRFVFYVRGGVTQLYPSTSNFQAALQAANVGKTIQASDPTLRARGPSARLGFILYLF